MRISGLGYALSPVDLYQLALDAGFPSDKAVQMAAIALRESGGDPSAYNGTPPDDSYGLWQINMYGYLGPARMAEFGLTDKSQLFDPGVNAAAAYQIWGGNDNNLNIAWAINDGGFNQDRYERNLGIVQQAVQGSSGGLGPADSSYPYTLSPGGGVNVGAVAGLAVAGLFGILLLSRN